MTYDLTPKQKSVLKWLVELVQEGKIRETFWVQWMVDEPRIDGREELTHPDLDEGALDALAAAEMLVRIPRTIGGVVGQRIGPTRMTLLSGDSYSLLDNAYKAVERDFGAVAQSSDPLAPSGESLLEVNDATLAQFMSDYFNKGEVIELCAALEVDYENISGDRKTEKILALVEYLDRRKRRHELIAYIKKERPNVDWSPLFKN